MILPYIEVQFDHIQVHSLVKLGVAVDCWQSFDVPSATASAEA